MRADTYLVTGAAGFIGSHVCEALLRSGATVIGIDNFNDYYNPERKQQNVDAVKASSRGKSFVLLEADFRVKDSIAHLFQDYRIDSIIHLGAMAGVRHSISNPMLYFEVNVAGTINLLDLAVDSGENGERPLFIFASSSSVYGATKQIPFRESDPCDRPLAPYPASKRAVEILGHTYHHQYGLDFTALRFFTVYGPRGRPDMMAYKLAESIYSGRTVHIYEAGNLYRDWTYIDDIVSGILEASNRRLGYAIINLGRGQPVHLAAFIRLMEELAGRSATLKSSPLPKADLSYTCADLAKAQQLLAYEPTVSVKEGLQRFLDWYNAQINQD